MSTEGSAAVTQHLAHPTEVEGLSPTHVGATFSEGTEVAHADPTALGMNGTAWVALAMLVLIAIMLWKKVPAAIGSALDRKITGIRAQLDEARQLRAEAEALKVEYEARAAAAATEADAIVAQAHVDAQDIVAKAQADATLLIERRGRMAEEKITAAERAAVAEVRARAASASAAAAAMLIGERHDAVIDKRLVDRTISGLDGARLN
ncbi:F0F1 ATP synthase subunit B [Sphingomonas montana]|uniref:F0F1 ATP synthase subunit B family protein n=1 Tax=Sphingomonas montana TaxID=1843236 RepID=UPI00096FC24C|nr:F0F1 ATP synthase subunit B [Sphingomonas montana]